VSLRPAFWPEAEQEFRDAVRYHERESPGRGAEFAAEVRVTTEWIVRHPSWGPPFLAGTRRKTLRGFPYSIIYLQGPGSIDVVAVAHQRRDPGYWLDRL
jgi:plasmid stabilization system protein ParE